MYVDQHTKRQVLYSVYHRRLCFISDRARMDQLASFQGELLHIEGWGAFPENILKQDSRKCYFRPIP